MTIELQSYLIDWKQLSRRIKDPELFIIEDCLEPDTRLQAIADAWRDINSRVYDDVRFVAPKLFSLLEALIEADAD